MSLLLRNGRLLDPKSKTDSLVDLSIRNTTIEHIANANSLDAKKYERVIDASGLWITPGFIDLHVHLREPGEEYKEDIATGSKAAALGGFTTILAMPNTKPAIDTAELITYVMQRGKTVGLCRVLTTGAATVARKSEQLAPLREMFHAGAVGFTDDGSPVATAELMRSVLEYSLGLGVPVMTHAEDTSLSKSGDMHEGALSTKLGLRGIPRAAEDIAVARDITLADYTRAHLHVCHVSTLGAVELIRRAKHAGVHITAEAAPHHFSLTHLAVSMYDTNSKMNPPLREEHDVTAVVDGLKDGTLDAIATDHAPHSTVEKDVPFAEAANGIIGLQTALPLSLNLWRNHNMPLLDCVARLTTGPAQVLGKDLGTLAPGKTADVVLIDPNKTWTLTKDMVASKSKNSPFLGQALTGAAVATIYAGAVVCDNR